MILILVVPIVVAAGTGIDIATAAIVEICVSCCFFDAGADDTLVLDVHDLHAGLLIIMLHIVVLKCLLNLIVILQSWSELHSALSATSVDDDDTFIVNIDAALRGLAAEPATIECAVITPLARG